MRTEEMMKMPANDLMATPNAPLGIVVIYEDFPARIRIQQVYWMLMRELSNEFDFECSWYGYDDLQNPRRAASAKAAAANADLILFSVDVESEPPPNVKTWVESWIGTKAAQDAALAALLNSGRRRKRHRMPVWNYLNDIAQRAGMSFLPQVVGSERIYRQAC
jgi:hypothetical protein